MRRLKMPIRLILLLFALIVSQLSAQQLFQLNDRVNTSTEIEFELDDYELITNHIDGKEYYRIYHPEAGLLMEEGLPELPVFSVTIAIPDRGSVSLQEVTVLDEEKFSGIRVFPSQGPDIVISEERGFLKDTGFYARNVAYPATTTGISSPAIIRDFRYINIAVTPFSFNPVKEELTVSRHIRLRVEFDQATPGENEIDRPHRKISRSFENIYRGMFLNYDEIRDSSWEYQARSILVIYHDSMTLLPIVNQFVSWKRDKGFEITAASTQGMTTNTAIKNYIQTAYDMWDNPPEYIVLMGGGSGTHTIPSFTNHGAQGDHPYGLLEGNDDIPDAFVGRFPIANSNDLLTIWNKIRNYEREPFMGNTDWYRHTLLVGDTTTSSGTSPKLEVMKYVKELMLIHNQNYQFTEYYSGSATTVINSAFNQGMSFFPFRGYIGFAGWSPNESLLNNGLMLPNCFFITCGTLGSFNNSSRTESVVNMGTSTTPKGAVAAIGMTTGSTRTTPNNALVGSFFYGIFNEGIRTMGETLARGKIFLHQTYGTVHSTLPPVHTQKASLMGDPSMDIWVDVPKVMNVDYDDELPLGRNYIDLLVTNELDQPIEHAWVTIRQVESNDETIFVTGYTDEDGQITHLFDPENSGEVKVTVTKPDFIPHLGSFDLSGEASVSLNEVIMTDPFDADSQVSFLLTVKNFRDNIVSEVTGTITTDSPYIDIIDDTSAFGNIAPDAVAESNDQFTVTISPSAPDYLPVVFTLTLTDNADNSWTSKFSETVNGSNLKPVSLMMGSNSYIEPGATETLRVTLENTGQIDLTEVYGVLRTKNPLLDISDSLAYFGNIAVGQSITSAMDQSFIITALDDLITGMSIDVDIHLYNNTGFAATKQAAIPVGLVTVSDPLGPCDYGYYIYGMEDTDYEHAPVYDWLEIAPQLGGDGVNTGLSADWGNNQNVMNMGLPFTFRFYGIDYDQISICANGWISFGVTEQATWRNFMLPGPLGPNPIVAAFWDNLNLSGGGVYTYHDEDEDIFIIQWHNATVPGNHQQTFQIILYNPELEPTIDDGFVKIQYKTINNVNNGTAYGDWSNFATVGIGDHTNDVGLTYTFANQYPTAAQTLTNESAIMIVGPMNYSEPFLLRGDMLMYDTSDPGVIGAGDNVKMGIYIKNIGYATAEDVLGTISTTSPYISMINNTSPYEDIHSLTEIVNTEYFEFNVSSATPAGQNISFSLEISASNAQTSFPFHLTVHRPSFELRAYLIEEVEGNGNGIIDPGETINLALDFSNPSLATINNSNITVTSLSDYLEIVTGNSNLGDVPPESSIQQPVTIMIDENCPQGEALVMNVTISGSNVTTFSRELIFGVSKEDIFHDFEDDNGGFSSNDEDGWQWGLPDINPYSGSKVWATVLDDNYANQANWILETPDFLLTPASLLTFYHYYQIENYWDGGNLKLSTDAGDSWQLIHPTEEYPVSNINSGASGIPNQPAYTGNSNGWQEAEFDLSDYFGKFARIRWHFGSGPWVNEPGWYIDDFSLSGTNPLYSVISGSVELLQSPVTVNEVIISAGDYAVKPDLNGNYTLVVPAGNYQVTASLPHHFDDTEYEVTLTELETESGIDFTLQYLTPPENLTLAIPNSDDTIVLNWEYNPLPDNRSRQSGKNGRDDDYYFSIQRQKNSGHFNEIATTTELQFTETLPEGENVYRYYVVTVYPVGISDQTDTVSSDNPVFAEEIVTPDAVFTLRQNYPNPFNPVTNISFTLPEQERVTLKIFNIKGELVRTVVNNENMPAGSHTVQWQGINNNERRVSSGIYFYRIEAGRFSAIRKAVLLK